MNKKPFKTNKKAVKLCKTELGIGILKGCVKKDCKIFKRNFVRKV